MAEHHASVEVHAPVHQVYTLFTHFNDFPKFMRFVKEVTYYDEQRSHWVAQIAGQHEWDAINEGWVPDRQLGWRSINGLENKGNVTFQELGPNRTIIHVYLHYNPPFGALGNVAEHMGVDSHFDAALQQDLEHFAHMVEQAPVGADDPMSSHYLFHQASATATYTTTQQQNESMQRDPTMSKEALQEREDRQAKETEAANTAEQEYQARRDQQGHLQQQATQEQQKALDQQAILNQQARAEQEAASTNQSQVAPRDPQVHSTIGGRHPSMPATPLGDMDARTVRHPGYEQDPMLARNIPGDQEQQQNHTVNPTVHETEDASPWNDAIRGNAKDEE